MSSYRETVYEKEIWHGTQSTSAVGYRIVRVRRGPVDIVSDWQVTVEEVKHQFTNRELAIEQAVAMVAEIMPLKREADDGEQEGKDGNG